MIDDFVVWILTFNRPEALNRLIGNLNGCGFTNINVFNNYPFPLSPTLTEANQERVNHVTTNYLNAPESNSWCARSWNSIYIKAFHEQQAKKLICIQDDCNVSSDFGKWLIDGSQKYDFIWGPAGDQFFYLTLDILKTVGFFDENFQGCYGQDSDMLRRVFHRYDKSKLSICESHPFGGDHNPLSNFRSYVLTDLHVKAIDSNYQNQHWELEKQKTNYALFRSQNYFKSKWGIGIDEKSYKDYVPQLISEPIWYSWMMDKYNINV